LKGENMKRALTVLLLSMLATCPALAQCIRSAEVDQYTYFVAVDPTDKVTRETGLSSFTVQRSRKGAAEVAYTTPTTTEIDATNMPGVYGLLLDEDTTLDAGDDSQNMTLHITHASMEPVTKEICIERPKITEGQTVTAANSALDADIERLQGSAIATPTTAGVLEVDPTHWLGAALATVTQAGVPEVDLTYVAGVLNSTSTAQLGVNVVNAGGTAWASGAISAAVFAANAITGAKLDPDVATELALPILQALGAEVTTIATLSTQTNFTLTAGSADDNAYNGWALLVRDASTATQKSLAWVSDYTGSTRTIQLDADPGVFTIATSDNVILLPAFMATALNIGEIESVDATDALATAVRSSQGLLSGTCDSGSTTTCVDDALTQAAEAQLDDRMICFPTAMSGDDWCALITGFTPGSDLVTTTKTAPSTRASKGYVIFPSTAN
jgi:hypothetical protein